MPFGADTTAVWNNTQISAEMVPSLHDLRRVCLWEVLESNHRFDLRMLDRDLVPSRTDTTDAAVLSLWDESDDSVDVWCPLPSLLLLLLLWGPPLKTTAAASQWVKIVSRWPGCPQCICEALQGVWGSSMENCLRMALEYYVSEFVSKYSRLPTPPPCNINAGLESNEGGKGKGRRE